MYLTAWNFTERDFQRVIDCFSARYRKFKSKKSKKLLNSKRARAAFFD